MSKLRRVFLALDTDRDGMLSINELESSMDKTWAQILGHNPDWKTLVDSIDTDQNGSVQFEEFLAAASDKTNLFTADNLRIAFDVLDRNGDGYICKGDLNDTFKGKACCCNSSQETCDINGLQK